MSHQGKQRQTSFFWLELFLNTLPFHGHIYESGPPFENYRPLLANIESWSLAKVGDYIIDIEGLTGVDHCDNLFDSYPSALVDLQLPLSEQQLFGSISPNSSRIYTSAIGLLSNLAQLESSDASVDNRSEDPDNFHRRFHFVPIAFIILGFCMYGYGYWRCKFGADDSPWPVVLFCTGLLVFISGLLLLLQRIEKIAYYFLNGSDE